MQENVIYSKDQFNNILELLINANRPLATKFMINKLKEYGYFILNSEAIDSKKSLLQILDSVHQKNPAISEEELIPEILEIQKEVRSPK